MLVAAMLAVVGDAARRLAGPAAAIACVLLVAAMPGGLSRFAILLTADVPLLAFALPMALMLGLWLRDGDRSSLAAAAVLAAGAVSTKSEGVMFVIVAAAGRPPPRLWVAPPGWPG